MNGDKPNQYYSRIRKAGIAFCIVAGIAIGAIIVAESRKPVPDMGALFINIGLSILCSLVASFIFILIEQAYTSDDSDLVKGQLEQIHESLKRQNELYDSGIVSIHPKAYFDKDNEFWQQIIENTDSRLELIGHSLSHWFSDEYRDLFCNKIVQIINSEKEVRVILSADRYDINKVKEVYKEHKKATGLNKTEKTLLYFIQLLGSVDQNNWKNLKVYVNQLSKVTYLYIRTDYQCIISPYILSPTNSKNSFLLELQAGTTYTRAFEEDFKEMMGDLDSIEWEG